MGPGGEGGGKRGGRGRGRRGRGEAARRGNKEDFVSSPEDLSTVKYVWLRCVFGDP